MGSRTLAEDLRSRGDDDLATLLRARPDLARPAPADFTQIASRAATRHSVLAVLDDQDVLTLDVVTALAVLDEPADRLGVTALVGAAEPVVEAALAHIRRLAMLWGSDEELHLVRVVAEALGPHPAGLGPPSRPALSPEEVDERLSRAHEEVPTGVALVSRLASGPPIGHLDGTANRETVEALLRLRLLVELDQQTVRLPREVALRLRGGRLRPAAQHTPSDVRRQEVPQPVVQRSAAGAALETVHRVQLLLEHWARRPPTVLRGGGIGVRDLRTAAATVGASEDVTGFLVEIAHLAGLVGSISSMAGGEVWTPTSAFDGWLEQPLAERWARLAEAWLETDRVTAMVGSRDGRGRRVSPLEPGLERARTAAVRRLTLQVLDELRPDAAAEPEQLLGRVAWHRPRLGRLRDTVARSTLDEASWLGICAIGALSDAGAMLLRTGAGAAADALAPQLPEPVDTLLLQADLTAVAPGPLTAEVSRGMGVVADVESHGGATVYRFSGTSVRRALDAGWPRERVHAFLAAHSRTAVPQPLSYLVDDIARRHGRLRVGTASLYLRSADPAELDAVLADRTLQPLGLRRIAPTVAVTNSAEGTVVDLLCAAGHSPLAETLDGSVAVRAAALRAPGPRRQPGVAAPAGAALSQAEAAAVVDAVRAGDRAAERRGPATTPRVGSLDALAALREAAQASGSVWLSYLDQTGVLSERIVDPVRVDDGWLTAYDHRSDRTRSFAVHRIRKVAPVG